MIAIDLTIKNSTDGIIVAAAVIAALGVLWRGVVRPIVRFAQRVEKVMLSVEDQLYPNHGSSLRDAVSEIQRSLGLNPKLPPTNPPQDRRQETSP